MFGLHDRILHKFILIIVNEKCTATVKDGKVEYPNCHPTWNYTYKIDNNNVIITSSNNNSWYVRFCI